MCSFAPGRTSSSTTARSAKQTTALAPVQPISAPRTRGRSAETGAAAEVKVGAGRFAWSLPKSGLRIGAMLASICK